MEVMTAIVISMIMQSLNWDGEGDEGAASDSTYKVDDGQPEVKKTRNITMLMYYNF